MIVEVTRADVIEAVDEILDGPVRRDYPRVAAELEEIARTAPRLAVEWWDDEEGCGCLIGAYRARHDMQPNPHNGTNDDLPRSLEDEIGMRFYRVFEPMCGTHGILEIVD